MVCRESFRARFPSVMLHASLRESWEAQRTSRGYISLWGFDRFSIRHPLDLKSVMSARREVMRSSFLGGPGWGSSSGSRSNYIFLKYVLSLNIKINRHNWKIFIFFSAFLRYWVCVFQPFICGVDLFWLCGFNRLGPRNLIVLRFVCRCLEIYGFRWIRNLAF